MHVLPARETCIEAFGWLAQQVRQAGGEAVVMHVEQFEDLADQDLIALYRQARQEDYAALEEQAARLEATLGLENDAQERLAIKDELDRLQNQYADMARIDYFENPQKTRLAARLARIRHTLLNEVRVPVEVAPARIEDYQDRRWVTRPHPHVDRLACAWLIRRFVYPTAAIRYAAEPRPDEVAFDMPGAAFSHRGDLCTFEVMQRTFGLGDPALQRVAEIVHEIDLRDGMYARPETGGVDALLRGWQLAELPDDEMESRGLLLFEGLYSAFADGTP
jgi:hypothetical protein